MHLYNRERFIRSSRNLGKIAYRRNTQQSLNETLEKKTILDTIIFYKEPTIDLTNNQKSELNTLRLKSLAYRSAIKNYIRKLNSAK